VSGGLLVSATLAVMSCSARAIPRLAFVLSLSALSSLAQSDQGAPAQRYAEAGQRALAAGQYAEAERDFEQLRALEPAVAEVHANLGVIYFEEKKFDQAIPELQLALKLKPSLSKLDSLLAMSLSEAGRFKEALPGLEKCFHQPEATMARRMCGLQLMRSYTGLQRDSDAVKAALELNRLYPDDAEILYHTGKVYGNFAFLTMHKLEEVAPTSIWRHQAAAEAFESQGSFNLAIGEYRTVLELDPRRPGIHYRIGRTLLAQSSQTGDQALVAKAKTEFEEELRIDPSSGNAAYELAEIHRRANEFDQAQELFQAALKDYPDFEEAHVGLAATLMSEQKPAEALPHLQRAIVLNPNDEVAWYRLARADRELGDSAAQAKAMAEFKRLHAQVGIEQGTATPGEVTRQQVDAPEKQ
jgi:tetratricopeptide (TPR) repeat protein